ncbi:hypothetical protein GC177_09390 [bacterium]|nr:hypothetical protein [bacterium]
MQPGMTSATSPFATRTLARRDEEDLSLYEAVGWLRRHRWTLARFAVVFFCLAVIVLAFMPQHYRVLSMIRIEPEVSTAGEETTVDAELNIIQSWAIINQAISEYGSAVEVVPHTNPFSRMFSQMFSGKSGRTGEERIALQPRFPEFTVPANLIDKPFEVKIVSDEDIEIRDPSGTIIPYSPSETLEANQLRYARGNISIIVDTATLPEKGSYDVYPRNRQKMVRDIIESLDVSRKGSTGKSGLIELSLSHQNPVFARSFMEALVQTYLQTAYNRSALGKIRALDFLKDQMNDLNKSLGKATTQLSEFRATYGTVNLDKETIDLLDQIKEIETRIVLLEEKRQEMNTQFTANHPAQIALASQLKFLNSSLQALEERVDGLPEIERKLLELQRDVDIYTKLQQLSQEKIVELKTEVAGIVGYARLINEPMLEDKSNLPRMLRTLLFSLLLGVLVGVLYLMVVRSRAFLTVEEERDLTSHSWLPLAGTIRGISTPPSTFWGKLLMQRPCALAVADIRQLQSQLPFIACGTKSKVVLFTGDIPRQAKHSIAEHFSRAAADKKKRVLLIDCDIANRELAAKFGLERAPGLSNIIVGETGLKDAMKNPVDSLWYIPPGTTGPNNGLLLSHPRFVDMVNNLNRAFDLIILDFPSLRGLRVDMGKLAEMAGVIFYLVRKGDRMADIEQLIATYPPSSPNVGALVLTDV